MNESSVNISRRDKSNNISKDNSKLGSL